MVVEIVENSVSIEKPNRVFESKQQLGLALGLMFDFTMFFKNPSLCMQESISISCMLN